jgi:hypothetical protein
MVGVVLVFLVCFGVGLTAAANWLPDLATGRVGGMAFVTVYVLLGAALGIVGLHTYSLISELRHAASGVSESEILAAVLRNILLDAGTLLGLAGIVYLLAPTGEEGPAAETRLKMLRKSPKATGCPPSVVDSGAVPRLATFYGIVIWMYRPDHPPLHFHAQ